MNLPPEQTTETSTDDFVTEDGQYLLFLYFALYEDSFRLALYEPADNGYYLSMMVYLDELN